MNVYTPGQRWISDGEAELGLGTVLNCDARTVTVLFPVSQETRTYSAHQAPLTRVAFGRGDRIQSAEGWQFLVDDSHEVDGLLVYIGEDEQGKPCELPETRLADTLQFDQARDRLLTGQVDRNDWFDLRFRTLRHHQRIAQNPALGFTGPKIDLIPHQLYIADEVANRHAPRVMLADEVGLGKTIEAGLILHRLLLTGRAERALVLVPDSLTHQWLVELLRRFALEVTLLDEAQSQAYEDVNPFEAGQLILASQQWLFANPQRQAQAQACNWDLLIVDEAHHLSWSPEGAGADYACIDRLAQATPGVLLLTATPEQMGLESHFARLKLLDPERYQSLEAFRQEERGYVKVAEAIDLLDRLPGAVDEIDSAREHIAEMIDDADSRALLATLANPESGIDQQQAARTQLREQLLDRHGTGRVMFRNSRRHVGGFPARRLQIAPLELPAPYRRILDRLNRGESLPETGLDHLDLDWPGLDHSDLDHPEIVLYLDAMYRTREEDPLNSEPWWQFDPRVNWLLEKLTEMGDEKLLVIAHQRQTALELAEGLHVRGGVHAPVFHEGLSLLERDRAAATFADPQEDCQLLICSEIGSEGRNFQFCHHLVMFDLPLHPDQLEQRIGRLDRIGQRHDIEIHVPIFSLSPGERLLRWYREGMDAFSAPHGVGSELFETFGDALISALLAPSSLDEIIHKTRALFETRLAEQDAGRNRLLELNACRPAKAQQVIDAIEEMDKDSTLPPYLERALDIFGVDSEEIGGELLHLQPSAHMQGGLPGLTKGEDGYTATFLRSRALARDDVQHLSWEHPLVREMMSRLIDGTMGNTALATLKHPAIPGGRLMVELIFCTHCPAPKALHVSRFLPATAVRVLLDETGANLSDKVSFAGLAKHLDKVKKAPARDLIKSRQAQLRELMDHAEKEAERELPSIIETAHQQMHQRLDGELTRLKALAQHNPAVREDEIVALENELASLSNAIESTRLRLDAVRVIVTLNANA